MPLLQNLHGCLKSHSALLDGVLILRRMSLPPHHHNPFGEEASGDPEDGWPPGSSLLDGAAPRDRNPFEDEEDENEANEGRKSKGGQSGRTSFKLTSPLKTLGKIGKSLRASGRGKGSETPSPQASLQGTPSPSLKKKRGRRSSEGSLLRFAGKYRHTLSLRKDSLTNGELSRPESECDSGSRRVSFMKMVGRAKKRESGAERSSEGPELQPEEAAQDEVKPREPLSVLEILQLVKTRDLLLADSHILELEQECHAAEQAPPTHADHAPSPAAKDGTRRKRRDVELLYEELQKELWAIVRESLRSPTAGPNLCLLVQVLQQEEQADRDWAVNTTPPPAGRRPRQLRQRWKEAVEDAADWSLPQRGHVPGELRGYLDRLRVCVVDELTAARRNVVSAYPEEYEAFQVYVQSYHAALARRLEVVADSQLDVPDVYSLLDWLHNIYQRDVLGTVCITSPFCGSGLSPLLPAVTVERLEQDCLNFVRANVTVEMVQLLEEEEKRWLEPAQAEEFQLPMAAAVVQRLQLDLERSALVSSSLGSRVALCTLNGLADFLFSFQRKVEMFHEGMQSAAFGDSQDSYVSRTIAMVNFCPPLRGFTQRCAEPDPPAGADSLSRAFKSLDLVVLQGVRVLTERLYVHIKPLFERLVRRKWLNGTEAYDDIEALIRESFTRYQKMESPPYQLLVAEVHRRVVVEYLRALMRGRIVCRSLKTRKKMSTRLRDEGRLIRALFKELESPSSWLDGALAHISEILQLEDIPAVQMEVGILAREFPDMRRKHVSALLNIRGGARQSERQEILDVVSDMESSGCPSARMSRDRAVFSEVPVTSEVRCLNLGMSRLVSCVGAMGPRRRTGRAPRRDSATHAL
ncbi:LOW QUALITY PROTEIN: exocyst complex component 3-like protein 2 [Synchiropus picturatus]